VLNNPVQNVDPTGHCGLTAEAVVLCLVAVGEATSAAFAGVMALPFGAAMLASTLADGQPMTTDASGAPVPDTSVEKRTEEVPAPTEAYSRKKHYGNTPTEADRKAIGGSPDHDPPLVKRYYEGDPAIGEKPGYLQTEAERKASAADRTRMNPSTGGQQKSQGGDMARYSKEQKKKYGLK
jgi:hypothetical protein